MQGKEVEEEGSYSRFMKFVKNFGMVVLLSAVLYGIDTPTSKEITQKNEPMQNRL